MTSTCTEQIATSVEHATPTPPFQSYLSEVRKEKLAQVNNGDDDPVTTMVTTTPTTTTAMYTNDYTDKEPKEKEKKKEKKREKKREKNCGNSDTKKVITVAMTNSTKW